MSHHKIWGHMKKNLFQTFILLILCIIHLNIAHAADEELNCSEPITQYAMNQCAYLAFQAADVKLNVAYKLARKKMIETDGYLPENMKGAEKSLLNAQRAWIKYRDLACETEGFIYRGGSMEPLLVTTCKEGLTIARTKGLSGLGEEN